MKSYARRRTEPRPKFRTFGVPPTRENIPRVFQKSKIGGKKPKGWEKKKSKYRISFLAEYCVQISDKKFYVPGRRHYITISNAYFDERTADKNNHVELESEALYRINKNVETWKQKEIAVLWDRFPDADNIFYNRAGSSWRIYRVG